MIRTQIITLFALLSLFVVGCGGKLPTESAAKSNIAHYLKSYAKKYPESVIGKEPVQKVEIYDIAFMKRGHANARTFLTTESGSLYQAEFTLKREPFGWTVESWEVIPRD